MKELAGSSNSANYHTIDPHSLPTQDPPSLESRAAATSPRSAIRSAPTCTSLCAAPTASLTATRASWESPATRTRKRKSQRNPMAVAEHQAEDRSKEKLSRSNWTMPWVHNIFL
ncbi:hypothetical protein PC128_g22708 [Phytophthora cactorum]|nr:hypothetical protein PC128_g22708 [Phytophthora cactorum]